METLLALHGFCICTCSLKGICSSYSLALFSTFVNTNVHHIHTVSQLSVSVNGIMCIHVPYFFGYKTGFFSFQNNPKVRDPSCKTDLEFWHCLGRVELVL